MRNIGLFLLVVLVQISCEWSEKTSYHIRFDEVENLTTKSPVYCRGVIVGKITSIKLDKKFKVLVGVKINEDMKILSDYQFAIVERDLFGSKAMEILIKGAGKQVDRRDTLMGIVIKKTPMTRIDSIQYEIAKDSVFKILKD
jgi:ABC-type transporter Mla subunit MlaD